MLANSSSTRSSLVRIQSASAGANSSKTATLTDQNFAVQRPHVAEVQAAQHSGAVGQHQLRRHAWAARRLRDRNETGGPAAAGAHVAWGQERRGKGGNMDGTGST